ncbi:MAG: ABC transporter ATP-binding protein [Clostridia bacterium]
MDYIVEMLDITKQFPGVLANDNITVQLKQGEILALLGENGAGKSTLMSILFGLFTPDNGIIKVRGKEVRITNPNVATDMKIGMVHQHFQLVQNFTVSENIILGMESSFFINIRSATRKITELSKKYGLNIKPNEKIEDISVGMQQRVEILKMLYRNADVLIFDEPTAVLTPQEIDELMKIMKSLIKEGKSIILITHKLKEIKAIADRCTIIRRGKLVGTVTVADTTEQQMAEMMVGREVSFTVDKKPAKPGKVILDIGNLSVMTGRKTMGLKDVSFQVRSGEIVGVAGVDGNGQTELVEAITGLTKPESGNVLVNGTDITHFSVRRRNETGVAHIPEDRQKYGLIMEFNLAENICLKEYYRPPCSKRGLLNKEYIHSHAEDVATQFDVRTGQGVLSPAGTMSGGNQQKAIVGREVDMDPEILIAVQPTRGLDIGAIEYIHSRIIEQRDSGKAVLLVSFELDEILDLSDRIAVLYSGELVDIVDGEQATSESIGLLMAGIKGGGKQ